MGRLAIRRIEYFGDKWVFKSPVLSDGLVIVEAGNGYGKTTFSALIYFGLGGSPYQFDKKGTERHKEVCSDTNNFVRLTIDVDDGTYLLTRRFDAPADIVVAKESHPEVEVLPVSPSHRRQGRVLFSDWILDKLGIKVVTLFFGAYSGKLNFSDVMRLIYHDQDPDPSKIYKSLDHDSFVTDSRDFRRAVFQILIGQASESYYESLAQLKAAERRLGESEAALVSFRDAIVRASAGREDANSHFLRERIAEQEARLERLDGARAKIRRSAPNRPASADELGALRRQLSLVQIELAKLASQANETMSEALRLRDLEQQLIEEVVRVKKIIHAHETLALFSPDTCPCCLRRVERASGHCVCGQAVEEGAYQKFFYSSEEYVSILKAKQKNVETVQAAIRACESELQAMTARQAKRNEEAASLQSKMQRWAVDENGGYGTELERVDDEIVEVRVQIEALRSQLALEIERNKLEQKVASERAEYERLKLTTQKLELAAKADQQRKIARFDDTYSRLMRETLSGVRTARLDVDADYMPIINDGEYREASSGVTRRLMYYLTMLSLSVSDSSVPFPRFLLIDTPETAGIDADNLRRAISKIGEVLSTADGAAAQVILTTGAGKYPPDFAGRRVLTLSGDRKLLLPRTHDGPSSPGTDA